MCQEGTDANMAFPHKQIHKEYIFTKGINSQGHGMLMIFF